MAAETELETHWHVLTQINTRPLQKRIMISIALEMGDMQLTHERPVRAYRRMRTIRKLDERVYQYQAFTTGRILGFAHPRASKHRGHGYSTDKGGAS